MNNDDYGWSDSYDSSGNNSCGLNEEEIQIIINALREVRIMVQSITDDLREV